MNSMERQMALKELLSKAIIWSSKVQAVESDDKLQEDPFRRSPVSQNFWRQFEEEPSIYEQDRWMEKTHAETAEKDKGGQPMKGCLGDHSPNQDMDMETIWTFFGRESSCHGVKCIESNERPRLLRVIWAVIVLGMACFLGMNVITLLLDYREHRTVTHSDVRIQDKPFFPSVTICNICPFKNIDGDPNSVLNRISAQTTAFSGYFPLNMSDSETRELLNRSVLYIRDKYSHTREDMISYALYEGKYLKVTTDFEVTDTPFGSCFTFNGPEYISKHGIRRVHFDGRYSGLRVFIKVDQKQYTIYDDLTAGIRVFFAHHPETPRQHKDGLNIHPGTSTEVALNPIRYKFLPHPFASYGPEYCLDSDERDLRDKMLAGPFYSRNLCMEQCHNLAASQQCSCHGHMLRIKDLPPCTLYEDMNCHSLFMDAIRQGLLNISCDCPRLCTFTRYDAVVSASQMPSAASSDFIMKIVNESSVQKLRENYVELRIYLGTLLLRMEGHEPQYTVHSIFAYLGGQMGFFLGASLITLAEVAEAMYFSLFYLFSRKLASCGKMKRHSTSMANRST